ncbi:VOC family protein [Dysgonomonas sp. 25]|uniref:VOC family protein n=1 Tax=Dysgonomonas sp. 25 TaxID=2302933 RepID=UPI0013D52F27|nr:VOC family protein [Dysgonomonas sp. 25]NDV68734.1 glyoxalase [Dysgonomonas sp. 25]
MKFKDLSTTFHTTKIAECKEFYLKYFDVKVTFDCDWYVTIHFDSEVNPYIFLSFMAPPCDMDPKEAAGGVTLNLMVDDVDAEYNKLKQTDIAILDAIADHEWGDRSFTVADPIGNILYIYSPREMAEKYKDALKA